MGATAFEASVREGWEAVRGRAWSDGFEALSRADSEGMLEPDDLEALAKAAYWTGRPAESIEADERAYAAHVARGNHERAAFLALKLRRQHATRRSASVAKGWMSRAERLLEDRPESQAWGYLAIAHGELALDRGELDQALSQIEGALRVAERAGDRDLLAWAVMRKGMVLVSMGRLDDGWSLMEEVAAAAAGGELGAYTTGAVFCNVVSMSRDMADYTRAREWSDAAKRWCERQAITGFPGVCRVHRAEVMRLIGAWDEAEEEGRRATVELMDFNPVYAGMAFHELSEVRLRMGDFEAAGEAFHQAHELGEDPQPGLALLRLAEGKADAAAASIDRSLDELRREAGEELDAISGEFDTTAIHAGADWSHGLADLAEGDPAAAVRRLRRARQRWREVDAPYEAARSGVVLAEALLADGDGESAAMELRSAQAAFERLGAGVDQRRAAERMERLRTIDRRDVIRKTFVFTDIVGSTALLEAIGDDAWQNLLRWHDEALRACVTRHGGEEVDHTGDGFFLAFPHTALAIACSREIQQELADHRRRHGFAPQVRIGLHSAQATWVGPKYTGIGVHTAARIGAEAGAGEIVASATSVDGIDGLDLTDRRSVELKGIAEPIEIVSIGWR